MLGEIIPEQRPRLLRFWAICGIAWSVVWYWSCIRITSPFCSLPAAATIWAVLAPFQSWESTFHSTSVRLFWDKTDFKMALVSPYGGRNSFGAAPVADWIACCVCMISDDICELLNAVICGCV
ncbi:hypothetical protein D3C77_474210 [compost metagenome]